MSKSVVTYSLSEGDSGAQLSVVFDDGSSNTITDDHLNFREIVMLLTTKPEGYSERVPDLMDVIGNVSRRFKDLSARVSTDGSSLFFDGEEINTSLGHYIIKLMRENAQSEAAFFEGKSEELSDSTVTWQALVKFLELLYANPNPQSRESLYEFIERHGLTIRRDGHFIAYKGLNADFGSVNTGYGIVDGVEMNGSLPNRPGSVLRFPRKDVDANTTVGCSQGLHAGTHAYASGWNRGKLVAVAINPMNVVSVPDDCSYQKIRVCEYEILNEVDPLEGARATSGWDSSSSLWDDDVDESEWDDDYYGDRYEDEEDEEDDGEETYWRAQEDDARASEERESEESSSSESSRAESSIFDALREDLQEGFEVLKNRGLIDAAPLGGIFDSVKTAKSDLEKILGDAKGSAENGDLVGGAFELFNSISDLIGSKLNGAPEEEESSEEPSATPPLEVSADDVVSFNYKGMDGTRNFIERAVVNRVDRDFFVAFVPAEDGYRSYNFERVFNFEVHSNSTSSDAPESTSSGAADETDPVADINIGDRGTVYLKDGESFHDVQVLINNGRYLTVRLESGGYEVLEISSISDFAVE